MPRFGDEEDKSITFTTEKEKQLTERVAFLEERLDETQKALEAFHQASERAEKLYDESVAKERTERRDAESRAFRAETALQEVLKYVTKIK